MAKVVFLQRMWYEYSGPEVISAQLKRHGHQVKLLIGRSSRDFSGKIRNGDIIAFSVMTGEHAWAVKIASEIKRERKVLSVFGGPHPTFSQDMLEDPSVDVVCRGEGEFAMLDLADAIDGKKDYSNIPNLSVKCGGAVKVNSPRPLISDMDSLGFPDRSLYYDRYCVIRNNPLKTFMAGRGCPFSCSFCFNEKLKGIYEGKGSYVRFYSPSNLIAQIEGVISRYALRSVYFIDDLFAFDEKWLREFTSLYRIHIRKPFVCSSSANTLNENIVSMLKDAGCHAVSFGIETGNERIRKELLNKPVTNKRIEDTARLLKKYKLRFITFNLIGFPGETVEDALETIRLNIRVRAEYPRCSFVTPYPGTRLAETYKDKVVSKDIRPEYQQTRISFEVDEPEKLYNLHCFFQTLVLFPASLGLVRRLIKCRPNMLFKVWWAVVYFLVFVRSERRGYFNMLITAGRSFGFFSEGAAGKKGAF